MKAIEIKPGVFWVGAKDWKLRNFHGYETQRGTTYNAYLLVDEKPTLVDTVKAPFREEMLARIRSVLDPAAIKMIVCNHVEMDHSGCLPDLGPLTGAEVLCSPNGEKGLLAHYPGAGLRLRVAKGGEAVSIGRRSLVFTHTPMVHWPDSMVTWIPEDRLLLPNDAFGQHLCPDAILDEDNPADLVHHEAAKYYANIVLPYGAQVQKALETLAGLPIEMIGPSHGVVWKSRLPEIIARYKRWASGATANRAVVIYDTMWGSTEKMAGAVASAFEDKGVPVKVHCLAQTHYSDVMTDVLEARWLALGSPTLNNEVLPSVAAFLAYLKGLKPRHKTAFLFGSHGWAPRLLDGVAETCKGLGWQLPLEPFRQQWIPQAGDLARIRQAVAQALP